MRRPRLREVKPPRRALVPESVPVDLASRLPAFVGFVGGPPDAAARLREADVAVVGAGSVGGSIAEHIARLLPRTVKLVDRSSYKAESILTHAHGVVPRTAGRSKALTVAHLVKRISPESRVLAFAGSFEDLPVAALFAGGLDAVFLAGDNLALEVAVGQACLRFRVPLIQASVHGETLTAQCRVFSMGFSTGSPAHAPCPACGFSERGEWDRVGRDAIFGCEPDGRAVRVPDPSRPATTSPSFLCTLAATLAVGAFLRRRLGIENSPPDCCLEYQGYTHRTTTTRLEADPDCRCEHASWDLRQAEGGIASATPEALFDAAGASLEGAVVRVESHRFCRKGICGCPDLRPVGRFLRDGRSGWTCRSCGEPVRPHPFFTTADVPGEWLLPRRRRPLGRLGAATAPSVLIRAGGRAVLFTGFAVGKLGGSNA